MYFVYTQDGPAFCTYMIASLDKKSYLNTIENYCYVVFKSVSTPADSHTTITHNK